MWDILLETVVDSLKMLPFLFGAYLLIEFLEHRASGKLEAILAGSGKFGALGGALLGCVPQCGFSVAAANLYAGGVITAGTLAAVLISTSDEAVPVLLANPGSLPQVGLLLGVKVVIAVAAGLLLDLGGGRLFPRKQPLEELHHHCEEENCGCEEGGILRAAIVHTGHIFLFILLFTLVMNVGIAAIGEENLSSLLMEGSFWQPMVAALVGFIPNCAASVLLTQLYLGGTVSFGAVVAGLCTSGGVGLAVLFRSNRNWRENLRMLAYLYVVATVSGLAIQLLL